jgi:hypothetical protein
MLVFSFVKSLRALHLLGVVKQVNGGLWLKENEFIHPSSRLVSYWLHIHLRNRQLYSFFAVWGQHFVYFLLVKWQFVTSQLCLTLLKVNHFVSHFRTHIRLHYILKFRSYLTESTKYITKFSLLLFYKIIILPLVLYRRKTWFWF